jgi:poly(A) polymerase
MLRAIRFAARFGFVIDNITWDAIIEKGVLLTQTVSGERIRDEFCKILMAKQPTGGLTLLLNSGLLDYFAPELTKMVGITQNEFHAFPVWEHTLATLGSLVQYEPDASLLLRLAMLLHDCGKPSTRTVGSDGRVHFYGHQDAGAAIAKRLMLRLKFSHADIMVVTSLVSLHMRIGEYKPDTWTDAAVRRFIRSAGSLLGWLFAIHKADVAGLGPAYQDISRSVQLRERINHLQSAQDATTMDSPLSGAEIMTIAGINPGPKVGLIKSALADAVIDGQLGQSDKVAAANLARELSNKSE